jgi:hypothetical protein
MWFIFSQRVRLDGLPPRTSTASALSRRFGFISDIPCLPIVARAVNAVLGVEPDHRTLELIGGGNDPPRTTEVDQSRERLPLSTWAVTTTCAWRPPWHPCRRARPGATVSMPLTWTQVQSNLGSKRLPSAPSRRFWRRQAHGRITAMDSARLSRPSSGLACIRLPHDI